VFSKGTTKRWNISSRFVCTWDDGGRDANLSYYYQLLATTSNKKCISEDFFSHNVDESKLVTNDFEFVDFFFLLSISCHKTTGKVQEIKTYSFIRLEEGCDFCLF
jgi:hypothetical protein